MKKAVVLFSGGLDSTTCLALAVDKHGAENVLALSMYYGQKHNKELECSKKIVEYYKVKHKIMDVSLLFKDSECSLLLGNKEVPDGTYEEQKKKEGVVSTYVPYRNGLFLSIATVLALSEGYNYIYYGIHLDDTAAEAYPDCSQKFNHLISGAIQEGSGNKVKIVAPFVEGNKAQIVKTGLALNVPYELTWSCYKGGDKPCGKCATCLDREKAFEQNGVKDPLWKN